MLIRKYSIWYVYMVKHAMHPLVIKLSEPSYSNVTNYCNTTDDSRGTWTAYPSGAPAFTPGSSFSFFHLQYVRIVFVFFLFTVVLSFSIHVWLLITSFYLFRMPGFLFIGCETRASESTVCYSYTVNDHPNARCSMCRRSKSERHHSKQSF